MIRAKHSDPSARDFVSPRQLAEAVGVSESSVKRWVDDGRIQATRTAGGHRRIAVGEAVRFIRTADVELIQPRALGLLELATLESAVRGEESLRVHRALTSGDAREVRALFLALYLEGRSPAWIVDVPLCDALERIGCLWMEGIEGVVVEHRATELAVQGLNALRAMLPPPEQAALALGGAVEGDPYLLPSLAVALVLEAEGFSAVNLGARTPVTALCHAVERMAPDLVWVSASVVEVAERLSEELADLARYVGERGAVLVAGGNAIDEVRLSTERHVYVGRSMGELEALLRGLRLAG